MASRHNKNIKGRDACNPLGGTLKEGVKSSLQVCNLKVNNLEAVKEQKPFTDLGK